MPQSQQNDIQPPEYILPNDKEIPIMPIHLNGIKTKVNEIQIIKLLRNYIKLIIFEKQPACIKQLTFSGWNPPPGKRKMKGDLMYLHVITMEDKRYHLTASVKGFFVNQLK
jgi:protein TIF31